MRLTIWSITDRYVQHNFYTVYDNNLPCFCAILSANRMFGNFFNALQTWIQIASGPSLVLSSHLSNIALKQSDTPNLILSFSIAFNWCGFICGNCKPKLYHSEFTSSRSSKSSFKSSGCGSVVPKLMNSQKFVIKKIALHVESEMFFSYCH